METIKWIASDGKTEITIRVRAYCGMMSISARAKNKEEKMKVKRIGTIAMNDPEGKYPPGSRLDLIWYARALAGKKREYAVYAQNKELGIDEPPRNQLIGRVPYEDSIKNVITWYGRLWTKSDYYSKYDLRLSKEAREIALKNGWYTR